MVRSEYGKVRNFTGITPELQREAKVHFEVLCDQYPSASIVEMRISKEGTVGVGLVVPDKQEPEP